MSSDCIKFRMFVLYTLSFFVCHERLYVSRYIEAIFDSYLVQTEHTSK